MKNIEVNFVHLCDYFSFSENGKVNILGGFKTIYTPIIPIRVAQMFIVVNITVRKPGAYKEVIKLNKIENDIDIIRPLEFNVSAKESDLDIGTFAQLNDIELNEGRYKFKILVDGELVKELMFTVNKIIH